LLQKHQGEEKKDVRAVVAEEGAVEEAAEFELERTFWLVSSCFDTLVESAETIALGLNSWTGLEVLIEDGAPVGWNLWRRLANLADGWPRFDIGDTISHRRRSYRRRTTRREGEKRSGRERGNTGNKQTQRKGRS